MHFGRVEDLSGIDLSLPEDAPRTQAFLKLPWGGKGHIHVGCPIWTCADWVGTFFPPETKPALFLEAYSEQLKSVELNSTFYHLLDAARIDAWRRRVDPAFKFCPKVFRGITEHLGASELPQLVQQCAAGFAAFGDQYGMAFAQLPENFAPQHGALLRRFLELWPRNLPLAVELRNPAWFHQHALIDDVVNLLYRHGAATVITDSPGRRDALHTSLTQPRVMLRFLGHSADPSDKTRLNAWADRLLSWAGRGLEDLYVFCHQPVEALIPATVNVLLRSFQMRGVMDPAPWRDHSKMTKRPTSRGGRAPRDLQFST